MANLVDLYLVYRILRRLTQPFTDWEAYKQGVIDDEGNILKKSNDRDTPDEKESFTKFDLLILKLKKLLGTVPFGKTKIASYIAALWFLKEEKKLTEDNLQEEFEKFCIKEKMLSEAVKQTSKYLYHGTLKPITSFKPFSHFGTIGAASDRLDDLMDGSSNKSIVYEVQLNLKNPARLNKDIYDNHKLKDYVNGVLGSGVITQKEASTVTSPAKFVELLRSKKYDGLMYKNDWEDPGSFSYVIFDPSQVQIVDTMNLSTNNGFNKMLKLRKANPSGRRFWEDSKYEELEKTLSEEAPVNAVGGGAIAGTDDNPPVGKKAQKRYTSRFANNDVFVVDNETYNKARLGKQKYHRYERYVGNDEIGTAIREYGKKYPKKPIILQDGENGPMIFLRRGRNTFKEHVEMNEEITATELKGIEMYADKLFKAVGIDVEFTRHFLDRVNDARNVKDITPTELALLFRKTYAVHGQKIPKLGPDAEAVIADMASNINLPFVLKWDRNTQEFDLVAKTVMRKKNFMTSNPKLKV